MMHYIYDYKIIVLNSTWMNQNSRPVYVVCGRFAQKLQRRYVYSILEIMHLLFFSDQYKNYAPKIYFKTYTITPRKWLNGVYGDQKVERLHNVF